MSTNVEEAIVEILDDNGTGTEVTEFNIGDVDLEVAVGSTMTTATALQTDVIEVATGIPGDGAGFKIVAQDTAPADHTVLWLDTSP